MAIYIVRNLYQATIQKASAFYFGLFFDMCGCHRSFSRAELVSHGNCIYYPAPAIFFNSSLFLAVFDFFDSVDGVQGSLLPMG